MTTTRPPDAMPASLAELHADAWTAPFWEAAARHQLTCARCADCGEFRMPPSPFCYRCRSQRLEWPALPGTGTVYTFTIVRHAVIPDTRSAVPYVLAVIELDGAPGCRLVANVVDAAPEDVTIGLPVRVRWDDVASGVTIPRFVPFGHGDD
jgi:uncharacterized protein